MKERPLLVTGDLVPEILEGTKTQTRRVIKPQPVLNMVKGVEQWSYNTKTTSTWLNDSKGPWKLLQELCPYGQPGDRLWVRETFKCNGTMAGPRITYRAKERHDSQCLETVFEDAPDSHWWLEDDNSWRPSIHMPRWASRITLEIVSVRVQRVQEISDFDAFQEGARSLGSKITGPYCKSHIEGFFQLWNSINADRGYGWHLNPWVWAITFRKVEP